MSNVLDVPYIRKRVKTGDSRNFWEGFEYGPGMSEKYNFIDLNFNSYTAGNWVVTNTQAATEATLAKSGGVLQIATVGDTENDVSALQYGEAAGTEPFLPTAGKKIYFGAEIWCDEATQVDLIVGLSDTDAGIPAARPSDGIYFFKDDGDTNLDFNCSASSVHVGENGIHTFAASTFVKVQFRVTGTGLVEYWVNDVYHGSVKAGLPSTEMRVSFGLADGDGSGGADLMQIRQLYCYQER